MTEERHILLVDDQPDMQDIVQAVCASFPQVKLTWVANVKEAKAALRETQFDAMITDNQLPRTGKEKVVEIKNPGQGIRLITQLRTGALGPKNRNIAIMFESAGTEQFGLAAMAGATITNKSNKYNPQEYLNFIKNYVLAKTKESHKPQGVVR